MTNSFKITISAIGALINIFFSYSVGFASAFGGSPEPLEKMVIFLGVLSFWLVLLETARVMHKRLNNEHAPFSNVVFYTVVITTFIFISMMAGGYFA